MTTLGSRAFAAGTPMSLAYSITVLLPQFGGIYDHTYTVVADSTGQYTGTGPGNSDSGPETVSGKYVRGSVFTLAAVYTTRDYRYSLNNVALQADGSYTATATDNFGGQNQVEG